jgi:hypothetical protein
MESDFLLVNDIIIRYNPAEITTNFTVLKHSLFYKFKLDTNANRKIRWRAFNQTNKQTEKKQTDTRLVKKPQFRKSDVHCRSHNSEPIYLILN